MFQDFTGHYCTLQNNEPCVPELAVLKTGLPHFDVFVAACPLGDALVTAFNLPPASNAATLAVIREQMKSQVQTTAEELQSQGFVSQAESDQQAELWKVLTLHSCIFGALLCCSLDLSRVDFPGCGGYLGRIPSLCSFGGTTVKSLLKGVTMFPVQVHPAPTAYLCLSQSVSAWPPAWPLS